MAKFTKIIDSKGRLFSKISIVDIVILLLIIGAVVGFILKIPATQIFQADSTFYITFQIEQVRDYSVNAVKQDDILFESNTVQALGRVVGVDKNVSYDLMTKNDGTALYVPVEGLWDLFITIEASGSITEQGYYVNGNRQLATGSDLRLETNMLSCNGKVYRIGEDLP